MNAVATYAAFCDADSRKAPTADPRPFKVVGTSPDFGAPMVMTTFPARDQADAWVRRHSPAYGPAVNVRVEHWAA